MSKCEFSIKQLFNVYGGVSGLTENYIYNNHPLCSSDELIVHSGATVMKNKMPTVSKKSDIIANKLWSVDNKFIVARKGQAGVIYKPVGVFTINDDAYVFELKKQYINKYNIDYLIHKIQPKFLSIVTDSNGNGTFNKTVAESLVVDLSDSCWQDSIANLESKKFELKKFINNHFVETGLDVAFDEYSILSSISDVTRGSSITEEEMYKNSGAVPIISAQTTNSGIIGYVSEDFVLKKSIELYSGDFITVSTDGIAGTVFIRKNFTCVLTTHAAIVKLKKEYADKYTYEFIEFCINAQKYQYINSRDGNGQFTSEMIKNIKIPNIDKVHQNLITKWFDKVKAIEKNLGLIESIYNF